MIQSRGKFIVFEGPDGSGKTTVLNNVYKALSKKYEVELTREPGGKNDVCESIRNIILNNSLDFKTEALLFAASRTEHLKKYILPSLKQGKIILSDRFLDSSLSYQGFGREIGFKNILKINDFGIEGYRPDFVFYFDIPFEVSLKRMENGNRKNNLMDEEYIKMSKKVNDGYQYILKKFKNNHIVVDANDTIENVTDFVLNKIIKIIES